MITYCASCADTHALAATFARSLRPGSALALSGPMGAGKTEFVRGFTHTLHPGAPVRSPSYTLVNMYGTQPPTVYHFDFYRLSQIEDLEEIGFYEYLCGDGICIVEWADLFADAFSGVVDCIWLRFSLTDDGRRCIEHPGT